MVSPGQSSLEETNRKGGVKASIGYPENLAERQPGYYKRILALKPALETWLWASVLSSTFSTWGPAQITTSQEASFYLWNQWWCMLLRAALRTNSFCNRREGGRAQLLKVRRGPRTQHKPIRIKWVQDGGQVHFDGSSISKLNDTPRGTMTVPRHCQKTKEGVMAQFLEICTPSPKQMTQSSHWLAYESTQPINTNHTTLCDGPNSVCGMCFSLNLNKSIS